MRALAVLLLATAFLPACSKRTVIMPPPPPVAANTMSAGMFINAPGNYHHSERATTHDLDISQSGLNISWSLSRSESLPHGGSSGKGGSSGMQVKAPGDPWFIFVESPGSYWICNGSDRLDYHLSDEHGTTGGSGVHDGKVQPSSPKPPDELIPRLPPEMQKLFPPVEPPRKRPSI